MDFIKKNRLKLIFIGVYAAAMLLLVFIVNFDALNAWLSGALTVFRPLLIGLVLAYLCNPFFRLYERKVFTKVHQHSVRRALSLVFTYLSVLAIIAVLLMMILPQLVASIEEFVQNFDVRLQSSLEDINGTIAWINVHLPGGAEGNPLIPTISTDMLIEKIHEITDSIFNDNFNILEYFDPELIGSIFDVAGNIFSVIADTIFGFFISLYLLSTKEKRYAQIMRMRRALFSDEFNAKITRICTVADKSFGGFFRGKLMDSAIVGVLTYCLISIFQVPYAILIAAVVAITDIIPVIGPFIGVIPSAVIILLTDPPKVIPFLLMILLIQQIDGNIIAPKILGEHTGVSSLCVLIAITTMGAIWGFAGMILGVPIFATVMELAGSYLDARLTKKGLPVQTVHYATDTMGNNDEESDKKKTLLQRIFDRSNSEYTSAGRSSTLSDAEKMQLQTYALARRHRIFSESSPEAVAQFHAEKENLKQQNNAAESKNGQNATADSHKE